MLGAVGGVPAAIADHPRRRSDKAATTGPRIGLGANLRYGVRGAAGIHDACGWIKRPGGGAKNGFVRGANHTRRRGIHNGNILRAKNPTPSAINHQPNLLRFGKANPARGVSGGTDDGQSIISAATATGRVDYRRIESPRRTAFNSFVRSASNNHTLGGSAVADERQQRGKTKAEQSFHDHLSV